MSAWIETAKALLAIPNSPVALFVSAWIETLFHSPDFVTQKVALFVSAWIETWDLRDVYYPDWSRTLRECVD